MPMTKSIFLTLSHINQKIFVLPPAFTDSQSLLSSSMRESCSILLVLVQQSPSSLITSCRRYRPSHDDTAPFIDVTFLLAVLEIDEYATGKYHKHSP